MHSGNIEDYSFTHGLQKNVVNGKWLPLHPHTLGRALTHDEMDYNLLYTQQTLAGFRIFGQNADLTLSDDELSKSLIFWKISLNDIDYLRYDAKNYHVGQYIWITPLFDCDDFVITVSSTTEAKSKPEYVNLTSINNSVNEGNQITFKISTLNIVSGTTLGFTITGNATFNNDYTGVGLASFGAGPSRGTVTITGDTTLITINTLSDNSTEGTEFVLLTLDATDSLGTSAGLTHSVGINDTSLSPTPTATPVPPTSTPVPDPTSTSVPPTATPVPTATSVPPTATTIPDPTATPVPDPTATVVPDPTSTPVPDPTSTTIPDPTSTPVPDPTATELPGSYISLQSAASINEGGVFSFGLKTEDIPLNIGSIGSTTTIGYTITGSANGNDYTIATTAGTQPLEIIANTPGYTPIQFTIIEDQITEGTETITITLDDYDNFGRETGMLTSTTSINDTSIANPMPTALPDPTSTPVPVPTATVVPDPTATVVPDPTSTPVPVPTATDAPESFSAMTTFRLASPEALFEENQVSFPETQPGDIQSRLGLTDGNNVNHSFVLTKALIPFKNVNELSYQVEGQLLEGVISGETIYFEYNESALNILLIEGQIIVTYTHEIREAYGAQDINITVGFVERQDPTSTPIPDPTSTPALVYATSTPVPLPTATVIPDVSNCNFVFIGDNVNKKDQGLRYTNNGQFKEVIINEMLSTPAEIEGQIGIVIGVCSTTDPQWVYFTEGGLGNPTEYPDGATLLAEKGNVCEEDGECQYVYNPEPTPIPDPTSTAVPESTSTPVPVASSTPVPLPTSTPVPLPTSTPVPVSRCQDVFVNNSEQTEGFGLRTFNGTEQNQLFSNMLGTSTMIDGQEGVVYRVCSSVTPLYWVSELNKTITYPEGVSYLGSGDICDFNESCGPYEGGQPIPTQIPDPTSTPMYVRPSSTPVPESTSTPVPESTSTPVPEPTSTPIPESTSTPVPEPTSTPVPVVSSTPVPEPTATKDLGPIISSNNYMMQSCQDSSIIIAEYTGQQLIEEGSIWNLEGFEYEGTGYTVMTSSNEGEAETTFVTYRGICEGGLEEGMN